MKAIKPFIALFLFVSSTIYSQVGREFWVALPDITDGSNASFIPNNGLPIYFNINSLYSTTVRISKPADPSFTPIERYLDDEDREKINIIDFLDISQIETQATSNLSSPLKHGFLIEAWPSEVTVTIEWGNEYNREIMPLKAENALGTDFWVTNQNIWPSDSLNIPAKSGFTIVATEDNTEVNVFRTMDFNYFFGPDETIVLNLNKGESFAFEQYLISSPHVNGIHVTSTKNIAITIKDDAVNFNNDCGVDMLADQIVPVENIGQEYFIKRGLLTSDEYIMVTATANATTFNINGVNHSLNAGEFESIEILSDSNYIFSNEKIYVNHISGIRCEPSMALVPPVESCIGTHRAFFIRGEDPLDELYMMLYARNDIADITKDNFYIVVNEKTTNIPGGYFETVTISGVDFVYLRDGADVKSYFSPLIRQGDRVEVYNEKALFHFGVLSGYKVTGSKYGYFSEYNDITANAGIGGFSYLKDSSSCNLNPVRLVAWGGETYAWTGLTNPAIVNYLSDDSIAAPIFDPDTGGVYEFNIEISGTCIGTQNFPITINAFPQPASDFILSSYEVCSQDSVLIENTSNLSYTAKQLWSFLPSGDTINQDTISNPFYFTVPDNTSDSIQTYTIKLSSFSPGDYCVTRRSQSFLVKPHVNTNIIAPVTLGCSPLSLNFETNTISGHDSILYRWDFGNGVQSADSNPSVIFNNLETTTKNYNVELVVETPFGCLDTANQSITVYPIVEAAFGVDTNLSCSPIVATLDPGASVNADSLKWYIDYFYDDSTHFTDVTDPITITHSDTSIYAGPDTLSIYLVAKNAEGCTDTSANPQLIVYPNIVADFDIDKNEICDNDSILFSNLSDGYNPRFEWDFGNSSYAQDSSLTSSYRKTYFNRSDIDTLYKVTLKAISGNFCSDSKDTIIRVHPYIKADFSFEYENNCSPLNATISNTCIGVDSLYVWDLGDGSPLSNSSAPSFDHLYTNDSVDKEVTYNIKLVTTNTSGCQDSLTRTLALLPEVIADFEVDTNISCSHKDITITNNSTGNNLTFLWKFGDNQSSTESSVTFTKYYENNYENDTTYPIRLISKNAIGCADTMIIPVEIFANQQAFFSLPEADSCSPFTIRPENLSDSSAKVFLWDFGNTITSTLQNPMVPPYTNTSGIVDTFFIQLQVAGVDDAAHWSCSSSHQLPIRVFPELDADFDLDTSISCQPLITGFINNTFPTDGTIYAWYRNNNYYDNKEIPNDITIPNNTDTDSTHTIWLYGVSKYGCRDTASHTAEVYALVDAGFTINRVGMCPYDSVYIDRTSSRGDISSVEWNFNGTIIPYTAEQFSHNFADHASTSPENRIITLTIENSHGCADSAKHSMLLYPTVTADYSVDSTEACYEHTTIFTNSSDNSTYWFWSFGDGLSSTEESPVHFYNNHSNTLDSIYNVSLIARSDYDCYDTTNGTITVWAKPKAEFFFPVTIDCPPFTVDMVNSSVGSNLNYLWKYADTTSTDINTSFEFNNFGSEIEEQTISLTVTSDKGCIDSLPKSIRVYPNLNANITTSDDTTGCSPLNVQFGIENTENIQQSLWYIDGTAFSSIENPSYRFTNPDPGNNTHIIKLVARSVNNCVDSSLKQITVFPTPNIIFDASPIPADYDYTADQTIIDFVNSTEHQGVWEYEWNFGDGTTNQLNESAPSFSHIYGDHFWGAKDDDFRVPIVLTTWNPANPLCRDIDSMKIIINPPAPQVDIMEDVSGCQPLTVDFSAVTKYIYEDSFEWEFGDKIVTSNEEAPTFTYTEAGKYHVTLTVEGDYGKMSDYKIIQVFPKPNVDFSFNDTVVSIDIDSINFYNHSINAIENYWYFDSENIFSGNYDSDEENPVWIYSEPGVYYPALVAKSAEECYDTLIHELAIKVFEVGLIKFPNTFLVIPGQPSEELATDQAINGGNRYLFYPKHESVERYHLEIYNRWGSKIFESYDVNRGWNGMIEGNLGKQDVYVYRVRGRFTNGQSFDISGDVTLLYSKPGAE